MSSSQYASQYYIGLMSGTSLDGIDAALIEVYGDNIALCGHKAVPFDPELRTALKALCAPGDNEIERLGTIDARLGEAFGNAALELIDTSSLDPRQISAIGSHGQTIRHRPNQHYPFTLQIGDPNRIAELTGITTVADFRRRDIAAGGQGAPLAPVFHKAMFGRRGTSTAVVNIGGIANVSFIDEDENVTGYDTGPGNTLLDNWISHHKGETFDRDGLWASEGTVDEVLLNFWLNDPYFKAPYPKSTGVEYFNLDWMASKTALGVYAPEDIQRTLLELTARSIADDLQERPFSLLAVCGGGANNTLLMARLSDLLAPHQVTTTESLGIHPDWVEAAGFAWLAHQTLRGKPGNDPAVTGASDYRVLGAIYPA